MTNNVEKMAAAAIRPEDLVKSPFTRRPGSLPKMEGDIVGRATAAIVAFN